MNPTLTAEAAAQLQEGINLVLFRWAALRMAVENQWGGRDSLQKCHQLGHHLFHRLTESKQVYIDDIEDMLDEFMLSLNTEIGDGSIEEGNFDSIKKLKETNAPSISYDIQRETNDGDDSDDDENDYQENSGEDKLPEMKVDEPSLKEAPQVEDGWTVVASRRSSGRRN